MKLDILAARKKAAERGKKKAGKAETAVPAVASQPEGPALPSKSADAGYVSAKAESPVQQAWEAVPADDLESGPAPELEEEAIEPEAQELESLAFRLGSEDYLVAVEQVKEVLKIRDVTPVPHALDFVPGVISLRGNVLPVIDLAKRLDLTPGVQDEKSRIIVVGLDDEDAGLIVDRVTGVVRFLPDEVQPAPETVAQGHGAEYLKGIVRKEGKLYILLDLEKATGQ